jgi:hypothetical protein
VTSSLKVTATVVGQEAAVVLVLVTRVVAAAVVVVDFVVTILASPLAHRNWIQDWMSRNSPLVPQIPLPASAAAG